MFARWKRKRGSVALFFRSNAKGDEPGVPETDGQIHRQVSCIDPEFGIGAEAGIDEN